MLHFLNWTGSVLVRSIQEDEREVVNHLLVDGKIKRVSDEFGIPSYKGVNAEPYYSDLHKQPHPLVLELAAENPANEENIRLYRKNIDRLTR